MYCSLFNIPLRADYLCRGFSREHQVYSYIKGRTSGKMKYYRVENKLQNGYPDITVHSNEILLLEVKVLRKEPSELASDVKWQTGQLAFAVTALNCGVNYGIVVTTTTATWLYTGDHNHGTKIISDFIGCF